MGVSDILANALDPRSEFLYEHDEDFGEQLDPVGPCNRFIKDLAAYAVRSDSGLAKAARLLTSDATDTFPKGRDVILADLITLIRNLAIPGNGFSHVGGDLIYRFASACGLTNIAAIGPIGMTLLMGELHLSELNSFRLLGENSDQDRVFLSKAYIEFVELVAFHKGSGNRLKVARLDKVRAAIHSDAQTAGMALEEPVDTQDDVKGELGSEDASRVYRRILGVNNSCSEEELKAAYRQKVALWHPDKLDGMAPELKDVATKKMVDLNEAYAFLSRK
jgi:hypothetical protein